MLLRALAKLLAAEELAKEMHQKIHFFLIKQSSSHISPMSKQAFQGYGLNSLLIIGIQGPPISFGLHAENRNQDKY